MYIQKHAYANTKLAYNTTNVFFWGKISQFFYLKKMISMHTHNLCEKNGHNLTNFKVYFIGITKLLE
jgi:hypothetical protein